MTNIIKLTVLTSTLLFLTSCVESKYKTIYKPVSYKAPEMPYSGAVEYCTNAAERAYDIARSESQARREARMLQEKQIKAQELADRRAAEAAKPVSYTSKINCSRGYGYLSNVNCTQTLTPNSIPAYSLSTPSYGDSGARLGNRIGANLDASKAKKAAFKNCMFEKGYKQVRVKKDKVSGATTSLTTSTVGNSRMKKAVLHLSGKGGVEKDFYKAFAIFEEEATEKNNPVAYFLLASLYSNGKGVEQDKTKARELGIKAARLGSLLARGSVLDDYIKGEDSGITLDQETAERWLKEVTDKRDSSDKDIEGAALRSKKFSKKIDKIIEWFEENDYSTSGVKLKVSTRIVNNRVYDASNCKKSPPWGKTYFCKDGSDTYSGFGEIVSSKFYPNGTLATVKDTNKNEGSDTYWGEKFFEKGKELLEKKDYKGAIKWFKKSKGKGYKGAKSALVSTENLLKEKESKWNNKDSSFNTTKKLLEKPASNKSTDDTDSNKNNSTNLNYIKDLERIKSLLDSGAINQSDFDILKRNIINNL